MPYMCSLMVRLSLVPADIICMQPSSIHSPLIQFGREIDIFSSLRVIAIQKYNKHIAKYLECTLG